jgi:hypothetical protein
MQMVIPADARQLLSAASVGLTSVNCMLNAIAGAVWSATLQRTWFARSGSVFPGPDLTPAQRIPHPPTIAVTIRLTPSKANGHEGNLQHFGQEKRHLGRVRPAVRIFRTVAV